MSHTIKVKVGVDVGELRHWAERHADRFAAMAHRVEDRLDIGGQHSRDALARLIRREIARADGATP